MTHKINPILLPDLFFAGRAVLTFKNETKGTHMTVKVKQARDKKDRKIKLPVFFVSISLLGDSEQGMIFAGTIFQETGTFKLSAGVNPEGRLAKAFLYLVSAVKNPSLLPQSNVSFQHEGRCCSCAMPLTHPQSISTGLGPDCLERKMKDPTFSAIFKVSFPEYDYR